MLMFQPTSPPLPVPQNTINDILTQHPTQPLTDVIRILYIMYSSAQLDTNHQLPTTLPPPHNPPPLTITSFRFLAYTMNIPTARDTLTHPQPTTIQYYDVYNNTATICPYPLNTQPDPTSQYSANSVHN